ncbi:hypothetical protein HK098_001997 [Nowakowskiella sp. JEL0407]|nr:hypothetical protein HK098_001997 [Nowakowskiella sp. JEL0407]
MTDPSRSQSTIPMRRPVSAFRQSEEYHARRLSALSTLSAASTFDDDDAQSYLDAESIIEEEQQRETENGYHRLLTMPDRIARRKQKQSRKELERSMKYAGTSEPVSVPKRKPSTLMKSFLGEVVDNFSASWNNGKSKSKYVGSSLKKSVDTWDNTASNFTTTTTTTTTTMSTKSEWESNGQNHLLRSTSSHQRSWSESDSENPIFGILSTASKVIFGVDLQNEEKQQPVVIAKPLVTSSSPCRSGSRKSITKITRRRSERITSKLLSPVLSEDNRRASSDGVYSRTSLSNVDESDAASTKSSSGTSVSSVSSMKITPELFTKSHLRPVRSTKPRPPSWFTGDSSFTVGEEETGPLHSSRPPKKKKGWSYGVNYDENSGDTTDDDDASSASSVGDEFKTAHAEYNDEGDVNFGDIGFKDDARLAELVSSRSASTGLEFFPPISRFETRSPSPRLFTSQRTNEGGNQEIVQYKIDTRRYSVSEANTPAATTPNDTSLMSPKAMMGAYFDGVYSSGGSTPQKTPAATFPRAEPLKRDPQGRRNSHQSKRLSITSMSAILPSQTSITSLTSLVSMVDISDTSTIKNFIPPNFYTNGVYIVVGDPYDADGTFLSKFTLYTLTVKLLRPNLPGYNNATACNFTVQRRYSDFRQFYLNLIRKYTEITNWPLLPRKSFFERFNATTIHERIKSFTEIMNFIALHPTLHNCQDVLEFLGVIPPSTVPTNTSNVPLQSSPLKNSSLLTHTSELNSNNKRPVFTRMSGDNGRFSGDCSRNSSDGSEVLSRRNYENDGDGWPKSVSMWGVSSEIHESPTTASGGSIANGGALTTGTNNVEDDRGRARNRQIEQAQERARLRSFSNPL